MHFANARRNIFLSLIASALIASALIASALIASAVVPTTAPIAAQAMQTPARQAYLVDFETGSVLLEKSANEAMPPASMSKLMTVLMVLERLKDGRLKLSDEFPVSKKAWKMGGSKMYVEVGKRANIEDLLRGIIVQSGNDACVVVAEGISGSESEFALAMSERAKQLGLKNSQFRNASGWPDPDHFMSARDLAILAGVIIRDHGVHYPIFSEKNFTYTKIRQGNRNPLLYKNLGVDGLKTGHTRAAGYGLVASGKRNGRRLILVLNGLTSVAERSRESERLINWGFREFVNLDVFRAGQQVSKADIWLGAQETVPLVIKQDLKTTVPRAKKGGLKLKVRYKGPIPAPIKKGQQIAELLVMAPGVKTVKVPLYAAAAVPRLGPFGRIFAAVKYLLLGPKL